MKNLKENSSKEPDKPRGKFNKVFVLELLTKIIIVLFLMLIFAKMFLT